MEHQPLEGDILDPEQVQRASKALKGALLINFLCFWSW